ncbi:hypothetical protein R3P38DRAFT_2892048 [Favolaschia claudopus]|uniref:Uncharacterized protein n=1 Tax=Favolaschia claudopus TaxID=2862362 RepID=A0AAW0CWW0_9AGAR
MAAPFDLKQVAKLFNDAITTIRDDTPDLEGEAVAWLKKARYKLMRDIETSFYELEKSIQAPLLRPAWAVDPASSLSLLTDCYPAILKPYYSQMGDNLLQLLKDCGFHHAVWSEGGGVMDDRFFFYISFPLQLTEAGTSPARQDEKTLYVEDEFSALAQGKADNHNTGSGNSLSGTRFGRLLIESREDNGAASGTEPTLGGGKNEGNGEQKSGADSTSEATPPESTPDLTAS